MSVTYTQVPQAVDITAQTLSPVVTADNQTVSDGDAIGTNKGYMVLAYDGANLQAVAADSSGRLWPKASGSTAVKTMEYEHHEIHAGSSFYYSLASLALTADTQLNLVFKTSDTTKWIHVIFAYGCSQPATFQVLEGPTITADSGTEVAPYNRDRNSNTTSTVYDFQSTPVQNRVSYGATISADGTSMFIDVVGGDKRGGSVSGLGGRGELILGQNTAYAFRLLRDSTVATGLGSLLVSWYEHTNS